VLAGTDEELYAEEESNGKGAGEEPLEDMEVGRKEK
jgi:hypothetical protein